VNTDRARDDAVIAFEKWILAAAARSSVVPARRTSRRKGARR
jgi:hypothetical protein